MGSPEGNSMSDGETTQISCIPLTVNCSPLTRRAKEILRRMVNFERRWSMGFMRNGIKIWLGRDKVHWAVWSQSVNCKFGEH